MDSFARFEICCGPQGIASSATNRGQMMCKNCTESSNSLCKLRTLLFVQNLHNAAMQEPRPEFQADWFKARKKALKLTNDDLAEALNLSNSQASRIINNKQELELPQVPRLAARLEVSPFEIIFRAGVLSGRSMPVSAPIISAVQAGRFTDTHAEMPASTKGSVLVEHDRTTVFALLVDGSSMNRVAPHGSVIVVDYSQKDLRDGQLCVARQGPGATFKRYRTDAHGAFLEPDSDEPRHENILPTEDEPIEIVGTVIDVRPDYGAAD